MNSNDIKKVLETLGFVVAHARRLPGKTEVRAYLAMRNDSCPDVDEVRFDEWKDCWFKLYQHAVKPGGFGQYDRYLGLMSFSGRLQQVHPVGVVPNESKS